METDLNEAANKIIKKGTTFVLATSSNSGMPQAATMLYAEKNGNLFFYTFNDSRKYPNLKENPRASIIIHNEEGYLQIEGEVSELSGSESELAKELIIKNKENISGYDNDLRSKYFKIKPTWIRIRLEGKYPGKYAVIKNIN